MNVKRHRLPENTLQDVPLTSSEPAFDIVLKPMSHPELADIRIAENLFAVGRTEPPFSDYAPAVVADLSRRHARIFCEQGAVYIADLDSKNGTTVNGIDVQQKITRLQDGDDICFGGRLSFRVQIGKPRPVTAHTARLTSLVLKPEHAEFGLQPIVINSFPFMISKADDAFSRYRNEYPQQVNYLSRRHAHIFLKGEKVYVEDLGSTNGTFVAGKRLDEHAVPLSEGDAIAFGGHHFVYKASLLTEEFEVDPTVTKLSPMAQRLAAAGGNGDKTTFVAAPDSFLDIFCVDQAQQRDDEINDDPPADQDMPVKVQDKRKGRGRKSVFMSEIAGALRGNEPRDRKRVMRAAGAGAVLVAGIFLVMRLTASPVDEVKDLLEGASYAQAAEVAGRALQQDGDNATLAALGTEAMLKAYLPDWLAALRTRDHDRAAAVFEQMKNAGQHNREAQPVLRELDWIGRLQAFVVGRGGSEAPIRIYADEDRIKVLTRQWEEDASRHQSNFATISAAVPSFRDTYSEALSHLRKLQSDEAVYLSAITRLKTAINEELARDQPAALQPVLKEYAEKYPRLALDAVRHDLRLYSELDEGVRSRKLGLLVAKLEQLEKPEKVDKTEKAEKPAGFLTPPFQERFRKLAASGQLPPPEVVRQYQSANKAWQTGNLNDTGAALQKISIGRWAEPAAAELNRRKAIAEQFATLEKARGARDYDDRLLAFYGSLDVAQDTYYVRAMDADMGRIREKALVRAVELLNGAQVRLKQYRDNGSIESAQRLEGSISNGFRTQARRLTEARQNAHQGMLIFTQLKAEHPPQWIKVREEIDQEAEQQRKALLDAGQVLGPAVLKEKLALLGGRSDGQ